MSTSAGAKLVLVGGHESGEGTDLVRFERLLPRAVAVARGRRMHDMVSAALGGDDRVVVVPMTFGRDPMMVADTAKSLRWLAAKQPGALAMAAPFGVLDHLTAHLRSVARDVHRDDPGAALVIAARASNPFDDAELYRVAHLVGVHGAGVEVMAATVETDGAIAVTVQRLRRLGFDRTVIVPAGFATALDVDLRAAEFAGTTYHGALLRDAAVARIVTERVAAAQLALEHGRDGIDDGLAADHGHGYAHSHALGDDAAGHAHHHHHDDHPEHVHH